MQSDRIEHTILCNLFHKEEFARKVLPFIKDEYFTNRLEQVIFTTIFNFITKYNNVPTKDAILIEINLLALSAAQNIVFSYYIFDLWPF